MRTATRIRQLDEYVRHNLFDGAQFICKHHKACRESAPPFFYEGQMSHIGKHYDLTVDGVELRIVVVGQEYGSIHTPVDLAGRTAMINGSARKGFVKRNPHMRGTTSILRLLLGRQAGADEHGEWLFRNSAQAAHIFDGFALVNFLLCSALAEQPSGTKSGRGCSSWLMRKNCAHHFRRTMEILEPTVIVAEGQGVRDWIGEPLALGNKPPPQYDGPAITEVTRIAGQHVDVLTFNHPSAPGPSGWWGRSSNSKYLRRVVEPTVAGWRNRVWAGNQA